MSKPVCVACQRRMRLIVAGVALIEFEDPEKKIPYRIWNSDMWKCDGCDAKVLAGFGRPTDNWEKEFTNLYVEALIGQNVKVY